MIGLRCVSAFQRLAAHMFLGPRKETVQKYSCGFKMRLLFHMIAARDAIAVQCRDEHTKNQHSHTHHHCLSDIDGSHHKN